jgi:hypothetical protein
MSLEVLMWAVLVVGIAGLIVALCDLGVTLRIYMRLFND